MHEHSARYLWFLALWQSKSNGTLMQLTHIKHVGMYHIIISKFSCVILQTGRIWLVILVLLWHLAEIGGHIRNIVCSW